MQEAIYMESEYFLIILSCLYFSLRAAWYVWTEQIPC